MAKTMKNVARELMAKTRIHNMS